MKAVTAGRVEIALLGTDIADMSGLSLLGMLRQTEQGRQLPILLLNTQKTDGDVIAAFQNGADDYIQLPCSEGEIVARIRAVLRRRVERGAQVGQPMQIGPVLLDPARHECRVRGKKVALRPLEFQLLEILMRKAGRVLSRAYLLEAVWGMSSEADTRAVDAAVSRLRKAVGFRAGNWVETVERFGYRFRETRL